MADTFNISTWDTIPRDRRTGTGVVSVGAGSVVCTLKNGDLAADAIYEGHYIKLAGENSIRKIVRIYSRENNMGGPPADSLRFDVNAPFLGAHTDVAFEYVYPRYLRVTIQNDGGGNATLWTEGDDVGETILNGQDVEYGDGFLGYWAYVRKAVPVLAVDGTASTVLVTVVDGTDVSEDSNILDHAILDSDFDGEDGYLRKISDGNYTADKANMNAAVDPAVTDDDSLGYSVGSRWFNTTANREFVCLNASTGAAVWIETTAGAGGGTTIQVDTGGALGAVDFQDGGDINFAEAAGVVTATVKAGTTVAGIDTDAIHDNVAGEISVITAKGTPTVNDFLLIEDAADSNNKKRITIGTLPVNGLANIVEDTTPELGNHLSANNFGFNDASGNELLRFAVEVSAVNYLEFNNSATGNEIYMWPQGDDFNIDFSFYAKGAGVIKAWNDFHLQNADINFATANKITSTGNLDIDIEPGGTGNVLIGNYTFDADQAVGVGQDNYVLTYDNGTGLISLETNPNGLQNIIEDVSPQLGNNLDLNGFGLDDTHGNAYFRFQTAGATAVNYWEFTNNVTGFGPQLTAEGSDPNISITITPKGTGNTKMGGYWFDGDQVPTISEDNYVLTYDNAAGIISLEPAAGTLNNIIEDVSPQLGNNLDLNGFGLDDTNGNEMFRFTATGSAVNYFQFTNSATGVGVTLAANGSDADVPLLLNSKGTSNVEIQTNLNVTGNITLTGTVDGRDIATDGGVIDAALVDGDFGSNGIMVRTGAGTYTNRSVTATASTDAIAVTDGDGVSGNIALAVDVNALTAQGSPGSGDQFIIYDAGLAALRKIDWDTLPGAGGGANVTLNNLSGVAINESLISDTNNTDDLGSDAIEWKDVWAHRIAHNDATNANLTIETTGNNGTILVTAHGTGDIDIHSGNNIILELGDAAGADVVSIRDSAGLEQASIDSDGNIATNGTVDGRDVAADGTKLDGIESLADVTDATNVAAAGAVMDSDFSTNGYMVRTGPGTYVSRTFTGSEGVGVFQGDGQSGATDYSLSLNTLSAQTSPSSPDEFVIWDTGTVDHRKVEYNNMPGIKSVKTVSAATGDEDIFTFTGTVNKATSGNYTGLLIDITETSAPGSDNRPLDIKVGGTSELYLDSLGRLAFQDDFTNESGVWWGTPNPANGWGIFKTASSALGIQRGTLEVSIYDSKTVWNMASVGSASTQQDDHGSHVTVATLNDNINDPGATFAGYYINFTLTDTTGWDETYFFHGEVSGSHIWGVRTDGSFHLADGVRQTFNPDGTNAGLNVGAHTAEPSSPTDGDIFYDSTANQIKGRANGAWVDLGAGGGGANTALSNLAAVAINTSLISDADNTDDLGSDANEWKDLWTHRIAHNDAVNTDLTIETTGNNGPIRITSHGTGEIDLHTGANLVIELGDAAGTNKVSVLDSAAAEVFVINSDGNVTTGTWQGTAVADAYISSAATWNAKANNTLNDLGATAVNTSIISDTDNTDDLGSDAIEWKDVWAYRIAHNSVGTPALNIVTTGNNGDINLTPNGTGNVSLGNYTFDADQAVGVGQDNYVLTYDNGTGLISLEAASGGGANTALSNLAAVAINTSLISDADNTDDLGSDANEWKDLWTHRIAHNDATNTNLTIETTGNNGIINITAHGTGDIDIHSGNNIILELGDAAGADVVSIRDSAGTEQASIDSDGNIATNGTVDGRDVAADGTKLDNIVYTKAIVIEDPVAADNITMFYTDIAITITQLNDVIQGTTNVAWNIKHDTARNGGTPNTLFSVDRTTSSAAGAETTTFNDATVPAGSWIWYDAASISGTPDELAITIEYTID